MKDMGNIYWLASYPKSGNTWMRALLGNYLWAKDSPLSINAMGGGPIASARHAFDEYVGIEASDLLPHEIERYRPFVYDYISARTNEPVFLKVHDAFTYNAVGHPFTSKAATAGVIYLLRNPLDVAVSFASHNGADVEQTVRMMNNPKTTFVGRETRITRQLPQKLLTWGEHVQSWVEESGLRTLVVRYEDTKADPIASFTRVVKFCGFDPDPERIARSVSFASFEQLKAQEAKKGFIERTAQQSAFFRKGQVGSWREQLSPALVAQLIEAHAPVMRRFGYLTESGVPVY